MTKIPIHDLPKLEKKIVRYHVVNYPLITFGLSTSNLFPGEIHQDDIQKAAANLEHLGFYGHSNTETRVFTHDGHHQARIYFKRQIRLKQIQNSIKTRFNSLLTHSIAVLVGVLIGVLTAYFSFHILKKEQQLPQQQLTSSQSGSNLTIVPSSKKN